MRVLSGIQPTGEIHLGNYLGAVKRWVELQNTHECLFPIVDLHALTQSQNPKTFRSQVMEKAAELLALGVNPETSVLFIQSSVREHTELAWIFNTITPVGELERMTQFKDKSAKSKNINMGLMDYPVLMAADILLYQTDLVPVGQDQTQHLELTRETARRFNSLYGKTFKEPKGLLAKEGAKIMSLKDPSKKMSKSDGPSSYLSMFEDALSVKKKVMAAVTDTGKNIQYDPNKKPGISNLLTIYAILKGVSILKAESQFADADYSSFKKAVADLLLTTIEPFAKKKQELLSRELYVQEILERGGQHASSIAQGTMQNVRSKVGLS
ncbi:MAG: tryptophan--tRNA ligase [bacterium]|nr:tryptophan--tRNA ligase [bacterium]MDZ4231722.1 tryptophan--tRNA ligase [Candidatus Pacearchaeota archaeon]